MNWAWGRGPAAPGEPAPGEPDRGPAYVPPIHRLTTLGWLKHLQDPKFEYFEWQYLNCIRKLLTTKWFLVQGGNNGESLDLWQDIMALLELDKKACRDLLLLAQDGKVGRAYANKILWEIMSGPALDDRYIDLSNLVTHLIYKARRNFDRPPREHGDLRWWWWTCYSNLWRKEEKRDPEAVPKHRWGLLMDPGGMPASMRDW